MTKWVVIIMVALISADGTFSSREVRHELPAGSSQTDCLRKLTATVADVKREEEKKKPQELFVGGICKKQ